METVLLVVTGVSLVAALFLGWTAWRLTRTERDRTLARLAALAAAVAVEPPARTSDPVAARRSPAAARAAQYSEFDDPPDIVTPLARVRPGARIAAMHAAATSEIVWAPPRPEELLLQHGPAAPPVLSDAFLGTQKHQSNGGQSLLAFVAFVLLMALGAAGAWMYSWPAPVSVEATSGAPLELISLRHARDGDRLSVTGMVRNPAGGHLVDTLSATVLLFDQQGGYLTSARGQVDTPHLKPGEESPFVLSVVAPAGAARYRVSFKSDERLVPHVDRRAPTPAVSASAQPAR